MPCSEDIEATFDCALLVVAVGKFDDDGTADVIETAEAEDGAGSATVCAGAGAGVGKAEVVVADADTAGLAIDGDTRFEDAVPELIGNAVPACSEDGKGVAELPEELASDVLGATSVSGGGATTCFEAGSAETIIPAAG
jgi:hypothetical protein